LQNKARTQTFDDSNEIQRLDFTYENPMLNQTVQLLEKGNLTDRAKEVYTRHRIQAHLSSQGQEFPEVTKEHKLLLKLVTAMIDLIPFTSVDKEFILHMPASQNIAKGDLSLQVQSGEFLQEASPWLPTYFLLALDARIQHKAMKAVYKMLVTHTAQVKLALLDQLVYLLKEVMLRGDIRLVKTL
jgi:hypothetical protein